MTSCVAPEAPHEEAGKRRCTQKTLVVGGAEAATHRKRKRSGFARGHQFDETGALTDEKGMNFGRHTLFVNEGTSFVKLVLS